MSGAELEDLSVAQLIEIGELNALERKLASVTATVRAMETIQAYMGQKVRQPVHVFIPDDPMAGLNQSARNCLAMGDLCPDHDDRGVWESLNLSILADYVFALARVAVECGGATREMAEPARRIALALHTAGCGFANPFFRHDDRRTPVAWHLYGTRKAPLRLAMEGRAVAGVRALVHWLHMDKIKAYAIVASLFSIAGHTGRNGGKLSPKTIAGWYSEMTVAVAGQHVASDLAEEGLREPDPDDLMGKARLNHLLEAECHLLKTASKDTLVDEILELARTSAINPPSHLLKESD